MHRETETERPAGYSPARMQTEERANIMAEQENITESTESAEEAVISPDVEEETASTDVEEESDDEESDDDSDSDDEESDSDDEESTSTDKRVKRALLTERIIRALLDEDDMFLDTTVMYLSRMKDMQKTAETADEENKASAVAAYKKWEETDPEAFASWTAEMKRLQTAAETIRVKIAVAQQQRDVAVEDLRETANIDLGKLAQRHAAAKNVIIQNLSSAGVADVATTYRFPELPTAVRELSRGYSPRIGKVTINGEVLTKFAGKYPTLTDVNKAIGLKTSNADGTGAEWLKRFGNIRDIPESGLSTKMPLIFNGREYHVTIYPQPAKARAAE